MENWRDNISFVLVEPREPGNIGAAARAIKNMGFRRLELVNPKAINEETEWMAHGALDVVRNARIHGTLKEALRDKGLVVGTSRRRGKRRGLVIPLDVGIGNILSTAGKNKVAILFGREDKGLNNSETGECGFLITLPTDAGSPSLNLAQSVLLVAYELRKKEIKAVTTKFVTHNDLDTLFLHIGSVIKLLGYGPRGSRDLEEKIMRHIRRIIGRAGLTPPEAKMARGLCAQIEKKIRQGSHPPPDPFPSGEGDPPAARRRGAIT